MSRWLDRLAEEERRRRAVALERRLPLLDFPTEDPRRIAVDGRPLIDFCSNDYLGFSRRAELLRASQDAAERYGTGARASRLILGNHPLLEELEGALARFKGFASALVFPSGYQANLSLLPLLLGAEDAVFVDRLAHSCLVDGVRLSAARLQVFPHQDLTRLEDLLKRHVAAPNRWIIVDGVYSMDGDLAPIPELLALAEKFDATVIVDDAHGTGTIGPQGRGVLAHQGVSPADWEGRLIQTATLSKALGAQGGVVLGPAILRRALLNAARGFVYTTGLAPTAAGAALEAVHLLEKEDSAFRKLQENASRMAGGLGALGLLCSGGETPIFPVVVGEAADALALAESLAAAGFAALAVRPPTVPKGTSRIRLTVRGDHEAAWIDSCCAVLGAWAVNNVDQTGRSPIS